MNAPMMETEVADQVRHDELLMRVGQLTRSLHESLRELGLDKVLQRVARDEIPNARDRLVYVAKMTEQAAQRVLNATEAASPLQDAIEQGASQLANEWQAALAERGLPAARDLQCRTLTYLESTRDAASDTRRHLLDIMMAQDFQDLTGQVIKKVTELGHSLESQLVQLLIDFSPQEAARDTGNGLLNGPQVSPAGKADVVADQEQVDDLLESLGF